MKKKYKYQYWSRIDKINPKKKKEASGKVGNLIALEYPKTGRYEVFNMKSWTSYWLYDLTYVCRTPTDMPNKEKIEYLSKKCQELESKKKSEPSITFDDGAKTFILEAFNKTIDKDNIIIDKDTKTPVLTPEGEKITLEEFGGVFRGEGNVMVFVKNDFISMLRLYNKNTITHKNKCNWTNAIHQGTKVGKFKLKSVEILKEPKIDAKKPRKICFTGEIPEKRYWRNSEKQPRKICFTGEIPEKRYWRTTAQKKKTL